MNQTSFFGPQPPASASEVRRQRAMAPNPYKIDDYTKLNAQVANNQARYGYMGQAAQSQVGKDAAAFGALQNMGVAGQNAMGQYGMARQNALLNSQIAQNNVMGQMGAGYYNAMGQGMNALAGMTAAASQAGADSNKYAALGSAIPALANTQLYGTQALSGAMGNMNMNFGGMGGFASRGPEGLIASGSGSSGGGAGAGRSSYAPPAPPYMQPRSPRASDPYRPFTQGVAAVRGMARDMDSNASMPNRARRDVNDAFRQTQANLMDPSVRNSLNSQMSMNYNVLGQLYDKSNIGFNTNSQYTTGFSPQTQRFYNDR